MTPDIIIIGGGIAGISAGARLASQARILAVSYTHLTLPTSDLV